MESPVALRSALFGSFRAEGTVLTRATVFRMSAATLLFLVSLDLYSSTQFAGMDVSLGFYVNQALILLGLYGSMLPVIAGAFMGGKEHEWRTRQWRLVTDSRSVLCLARLALLVVLSFACVIVGGSIGGFLEIVGGHDSHGLGALAVRIGYVSAVLLLWGLVGFLISAWSRSFAVGVLVSLVWIILEPQADFYLPVGVAQVLPMWNIKIVLQALFPNQDGMMAVILPSSGSSTVSAMIVVAYLVAVLILGYAVSRRRDW